MIDGIQGAETIADKTKRFAGPQANVLQRESGRYVKYLGPEMNRASERLITAEQWGDVKIQSDRGHLWDFRNDYMLSESLFTPAQLDYLLNVDGFFSSVEVK